eukprot:9052878-Lingulodinium_polyedra.AAC.1
MAHCLAHGRGGAGQCVEPWQQEESHGLLCQLQRAGPCIVPRGVLVSFGCAASSRGQRRARRIVTRGCCTAPALVAWPPGAAHCR